MGYNPPVVNPYVQALLLLLAAAGIGTVLAILPSLTGPRRPRVRKEQTYECGVPLQDTADRPFPIHFYLVAMAFILFDIEVAFLFPWAVAARDLGAWGLGAAGLFVGILTLGLVYVWRSGVLEAIAPPNKRRSA